MKIGARSITSLPATVTRETTPRVLVSNRLSHCCCCSREGDAVAGCDGFSASAARWSPSSTACMLFSASRGRSSWSIVRKFGLLPPVRPLPACPTTQSKAKAHQCPTHWRGTRVRSYKNSTARVAAQQTVSKVPFRKAITFCPVWSTSRRRARTTGLSVTSMFGCDQTKGPLVLSRGWGRAPTIVDEGTVLSVIVLLSPYGFDSGGGRRRSLWVACSGRILRFHTRCGEFYIIMRLWGSFREPAI